MQVRDGGGEWHCGGGGKGCVGGGGGGGDCMSR